MVVLVAACGVFSDRMLVGTFFLPLAVARGRKVWRGKITIAETWPGVLAALAGCALGLVADTLVFPALLTRQADVPVWRSRFGIWPLTAAIAEHPLLAWQDPIAACIAPTGRLQGLADCWRAWPITVSSDWRLQVLQIDEVGRARIWANNLDGYARSGNLRGTVPVAQARQHVAAGSVARQRGSRRLTPRQLGAAD